MVINQYDVYWVNLDPTKGSEVSKTRPCVIISPDDMNLYIQTVIIAPLTHTIKHNPSRVLCEVTGQKGSVTLDQLRTIDKSRLGNRLGNLGSQEIADIKYIINQMLC
ncbi:MAG: type II toxin-antitoxin system PemK/MazF family toxin [Mucilaginibacter sp.]